MKLPLLIWLLLSLIWGSTWFVIKLGLENLSPFSFAGVRFLLALIPLSIACIIRKCTIPKDIEILKLIAILGLISVSLNFGLIFWAESYISSGLTAILYATHPLFGVIFSHIYLSAEPTTWPKIIGIICGFIGIAIIYYGEIAMSNYAMILPSLAVIIASFGTAYATVLIKRKEIKEDPLIISTLYTLVGCIPLLIIAFIFEEPLAISTWKLREWGSILYLAFIGSAVATFLCFWLIPRMEASKIHLIFFSSTLIAVFIGNVFLKESFYWNTVLGGFCLLVGLIVSFVKKKTIGSVHQ